MPVPGAALTESVQLRSIRRPSPCFCRFSYTLCLDLSIHWSNAGRTWRDAHAVVQRCPKDAGGRTRRRLPEPDLEPAKHRAARFQILVKKSSETRTSRIFRAALRNRSPLEPTTSSIRPEGVENGHGEDQLQFCRC